MKEVAEDKNNAEGDMVKQLGGSEDKGENDE